HPGLRENLGHRRWRVVWRTKDAGFFSQNLRLGIAVRFQKSAVHKGEAILEVRDANGLSGAFDSMGQRCDLLLSLLARHKLADQTAYGMDHFKLPLIRWDGLLGEQSNHPKYLISQL